jgi:LysR family transcriptional regulator, glycine cleavage system transcriptional activator
MHRLRSLVPSANYLFAFEAAARRKSFTAAADELNVSQPAVSKTIRLLEEATGLKLFRRQHNQLELTAEGARLYREVQESLDHLYMVIASLQREHATDLVRVSFSASFVQLWLLPRLRDFRDKHPEVTLRIEESSRDDQDLAAENIDLSARLGSGSWPGMQAWKFVAEEVVPVCSPDYLAARGPITTAADLLNHPLLDFEERYRTRMGWWEWLKVHGVRMTRRRENVVFTDLLGSVKAAALGEGIALGWRHLVEDYLASGQLVTPLQETYRSGHAVYLVMPAQRPAKRGTEVFRDWLLAQVEVG